MIDFQIKTTKDGILIAIVHGSLEDSTCKYFFDCMRDLIEEGHRHIVVDCEGLGYVSSYGLGTLVRFRFRAIKNGGRIYLASINAAVTDGFVFSGLCKLLNIYRSPKVALINIRKLFSIRTEANGFGAEMFLSARSDAWQYDPKSWLESHRWTTQHLRHPPRQSRMTFPSVHAAVKRCPFCSQASERASDASPSCLCRSVN